MFVIDMYRKGDAVDGSLNCAAAPPCVSIDLFIFILCHQNDKASHHRDGGEGGRVGRRNP